MENETEKRAETQAGPRRTLGHRLVGWTRFVATVPILGLFLAAVVMTVATFIQTILVTVEAVTSEIGIQSLLASYIEFADFFLLSIVLYIMAIGLYSLFINDKIELPPWLEFHSLDDLKEKLVSVVVVVMGVAFLGQVLHGAAAQDLLYVGVGVGAVVFSLAYFVSHVMAAHMSATDGKEDADGGNADDVGKANGAGKADGTASGRLDAEKGR